MFVGLLNLFFFFPSLSLVCSVLVSQFLIWFPSKSQLGHFRFNLPLIIPWRGKGGVSSALIPSSPLLATKLARYTCTVPNWSPSGPKDSFLLTKCVSPIHAQFFIWGTKILGLKDLVLSYHQKRSQGFSLLFLFPSPPPPPPVKLHSI